ncbi:MAG: hypothetical protein ABI333_06555 [bacterium]
MKARNGLIVGTIALFGLVMPQVAQAQTALILKYMNKDATVLKYMDLGINGNQFRMRWKHPVALKIAKECSQTSYLYCKHAWKAFSGSPMKGAMEFVKGTMEAAKWGNNGKYWTWKFQYYKSGIGPRSMLGSVVFNVPDAAKLIAATMDAPEKIKTLHTGSDHEPMQALWYLGAKQYTDTIINSLGHWSFAAHRNFAMYFLWNWKLSAAQKKKIADHCVDQVFKGTESKAKRSLRACALFLGMTKSKHPKAKQYLENMIEGQDGAKFAIRALGLMGHKGAKRDLQKMLKKQKSWKHVYKGRGRRAKRVKMDTWGAYQNSFAAAVALLSMGDGNALKAIKYWASYDKAKKRLFDTSGFEELAYDAPFAGPKAAAKIKGVLLGALKMLTKDEDSNRDNKRYKRAAIIGLAQMGAKKVMKPLLEELRGRDARGLLTVLKDLGGNKSLWDDSRTGLVGIKVGKGGFSIAQAKKIAKYIRGRLEFYNDDSAKRFAIQAVLDIEARIKAAGK